MTAYYICFGVYSLLALAYLFAKGYQVGYDAAQDEARRGYAEQAKQYKEES
jgi:hypothetical protein